MSTSSRNYADEITPERIAEISRRAHIERSKALWRLLEGIFGSHASDEMPGAIAKPQR